MKKSVSSLALSVALSSIAFADEKPADAKPTLEAECRAIAESHGVAPEQMGDWMRRCQERTKEAQRRMDEKDKGHDMEGMGQGTPGGKPMQ